MELYAHVATGYQTPVVYSLTMKEIDDYGESWKLGGKSRLLMRFPINLQKRQISITMRLKNFC